MSEEQPKLSVILHGGAGRFHPDRATQKIPVMKKSLDAAWAVLEEGGEAPEAVTAALKIMEESQYFNAGYGGYPNADGIVLLDAAIMNGTRSFVALMNVRRLKYPSAAALDLLRHGDSLTTIWTHQLMQSLDNADAEKKERYGWVRTHEELLPTFVIETLASGEGEFSPDGTTHGTVGCVARDATGNIAAAISTGGVNHKVNGRVGDAPMVGLGLYADNDLCGMTTTGNGEALLSCFPTGFIICRIRAELRNDPEVFKRDPELAHSIIEEEFQEFKRKSPIKGGGIILIPKDGPPSYSFSTEAIPVGVRSGTASKVDRDEVFIDRRDGGKVY